MTSSPQEESNQKSVLTEVAPSAERLPVVPIRDVVLFPMMVLPIAVGREKSVRALEAASAKYNRRLFLVTQKAAQVEDPSLTDLYTIGAIGEIVQVFKLPDGSVKTFVQGTQRARIVRLVSPEGYLEADVEVLEGVLRADPMEIEALLRQLRQAFSQYAQLNPAIPQDVANLVAGIETPDRLADVLAANVALKLPEKQELLSLTDTVLRLEKLYALLVREIDILNLEKKIQSRVRHQIEKTQKEYILNEQMKAIQKELRQRDDHSKELEDLRSQVKKAQMTKEAQEAATKELTRLEKMAPYSPEATVARSYLDWLIAMPWASLSKDKIDLKRTAEILDEDHYGLEKAKERILEYLAVCLLKKSLRGPILCFVGPPGVGKTSLARSIARSLGRQFARVSMGGVRDESEIRGHRRTYIGALPGRMIQQLRKSKTRNPVFLLDEIDKMGTDWRGDPAAALLEVLDPEQNQNFVDHYLDVGFDLSSVFFVTTANTTYTIPNTLLDRMEIIRFSDYTLREKQEISKRYLIPKQIEEHGLSKKLKLDLSDEALGFIIEKYTREAGVRNLDREIAKLTRKMAREIAESKKPVKKGSAAKIVNRKMTRSDEVQKYLGVPKFVRLENAQNGIGVVTGLAWTEYGGEILTIEVVQVPGRGELILTGKLGATMQESAQAAFTYVRSRGDRLAFDSQQLKNHNFHLHVPEGAVPKDGPSAGVAMAVSLASYLTRRPVKAHCAMTGEITLLGRVLPVGGIREKLIAAHRHGVKTVYIPQDNEKDLEDVPAEVREGLTVKPVSHVDEILEKILL